MFKYIQLVDMLTTLFWNREDFESIARGAGYNLGKLMLTSVAYHNWMNLVTQASQSVDEKKMLDLLHSALILRPDNDYLLAMQADLNTSFQSPMAGKHVSWQGKSALQQEGLTNKLSTLLPVNFLAKGIDRSKCVAKITTSECLGTGFLLRGNYLLTNNHVIPTGDIAAKTRLQFNYEYNVSGALLQPIYYDLDPDNGFETAPETDWTIVKIKGDAVKEFGHLTLSANGVKADDFVNIIQHPGGDHKQIALYHNTVAYANGAIVQYLTDTLPGSSGCPVFNSAWEVVALHTSGGWTQDPTTLRPVLRNQGADIRVVKSEIAGRIKGIEI